MKTFTRISILVLVMLISSAVVFAQSNASKTTISQEELKAMQSGQVNPFPNAGGDQDWLATPITSFPYFQDFEAGTMPAELDPQPGSNAGVRISATASSGAGSWGLLSEGNTSTGWGSTPYSYAAAFDPSKASHFGTTVIDVVPDGSAGTLKLQFQLGMGYTFNTNYSWFRVLVNGTAVTDLNSGDYYFQPTTHWTGSQWSELEFDLSAYDGAPFTIQLQSSMKYYEGYSGYEGDLALVDDLKIWYELPPGDIEGYVMNGGGLSISGATVGIENFGTTQTDPTGYYMLVGAPGGTQPLTAAKAGYNVVTVPAWVEPLGLGYQDITLTAPTMFISPTFHEYTLNPEEYFTTQTGIINSGDGPLYWSAEVVYPVTDFIQTSNEPRTSFPNPNTEYSPNVQTVQVINPAQRALWDVQLNFATAVNSGEAGVETNGNFIYTTIWNGSGFEQYAMDGTYIGHVECGGANGIRDMAFDGTYFYGAAAATSVSIMDLDNGVLIGTINAPTATRAIAYDDDVMGFYSNNWDTDITLWDMTGAFISSFPVGANGSLYGMAYDKWSDNGPYLWAFSQAGSGAVMAQYDLATTTEIFSLDVIPLVGGTQIAGGAFTTGSIVPGFISLGGNLQNELVFALELAVGSTGGVGDWLTLDWYEGVNAGFGYVENVPTNFNAAGTQPGDVYTADIVFTSDPDVGTTTIPCTMIIAGDPLVPPTNLVVTLTDDINGIVTLSWDWTTDATFEFFIIKRDGTPIGTSTTTSYIDNLPDYGNYCYTVQAYYTEGTTAPAGPECVEWPLPEIMVNPTFHEAWVWVDATYNYPVEIRNNGIGTLQYTFPNYVTTDIFPCQHEIIMEDDFGDGWNGGSLDVYLDGNIVLAGVTLSSGSGPESVFFTAETGQQITTTFTCGSWCYECSYEIVDGFGNVIAADGQGGVNPTGISAGQNVFAACPIPSYIVDVDPATGLVGEGDAAIVTVYWDATGFPPGDYPEDLLVESNDPVTPEVIIANLMHVYVPAEFAGTVTDCETGAGISGVTVTAGAWQTITDMNGDYSLFVDEGTYDIDFAKLGYQNISVLDTFALAGDITPVDVCMFEEPYTVPWVTATVNYPDEDFCLVEWSLPEGGYELLYEDGSAEDFFVWATPNNENAVKFTPAGYPAEVFGGRVFIGDGSFPAGNWLGTFVMFYVYDDDGTNGMPGTAVDSALVEVLNYGWLEIAFPGGASFDDGEFYISMKQLNYSPFSAPVGIDLDLPVAFRSYSRMAGTEWNTSVYQDFMIRAYVNGPQTDAITDESIMIYPPKVPSTVNTDEYFTTLNNSPFVKVPGTQKAGQIANIDGLESNTDDVVQYTVARLSDFDPLDNPLLGTLTPIANTTDLEYQDDAFNGLPMGWYAYAVSVTYSSGLASPWTVSNIVGRDMDAAVTFEVTLCDGVDPEDVEISMYAEDYPFIDFFGVTDITGIYTFDQVWKGDYTIEVTKIGYETYIYTATITGDETFEVVLSVKKYAPRNLWVDPMTSYAYWDPPLIMAVFEDFEGADFPPAGWQMTTNDAVGWFQTANGSSSGFSIPAWNSLYACANDDEDPAGSDGDGSVDYLITPPLDLREVDTYHMMFDSYYDGAYGQLAFVEYSYDAGATWDVLYALTPNPGAWAYIDVDLAGYTGLSAPAPIWLAFHADDAGTWASGWAVDNALVANGEANPDGYHVYLDGAFTAQVDTTFYQYIGLTYGVTYTASVAALYSGCGLSEEIYYTFTSGFLYPPRNLDGVNQDDAVHLWWEPPLTAVTFEVLSEVARTEFPNPVSEYSPMVRTVTVTGGATRDAWDLQIVFPCGDASGEAGVESDGNYVYTTKWNAGSGTFFQYEMDGTFNGPLNVTGGAQDVRDLAYNDDDGLFYGSNAGNTVWGINFTTLTVDNTISAPTQCRAIAYDNDAMGFWANNWSTDITLFDMTGALQTSFPVSGLGSYYGFAYDYWTDGTGTPYLWGFSQDGAASAELVQMDLNAGGTQIFTQPVGPIVGGTEIGGGLYTHCGAYESGKVTLGGIRQNDVIFAIELTTCSSGGGGGGGGGVVPDNLLGYNLYRDMQNIAYIPYNGEDTTFHWDLELEPLCYQYDVTALYDLTPYGFPGDTGESVYEGPKDICVEYGWPLPFVEDWNTGSFDPNLWTNGENWVINGQVGNDMPSAEFMWDPILTDYRSSLTSYPIDGMYHPVTGEEYIDGKIYFDFDVRLDDVNATGLETLLVEIWKDGTWTTLATFDNANGSFDWTSSHIDITNKAFGEIFKVRFTADGALSSDILSWFVDNVNIYRECDAPTDLIAVGYDEYEIDLNWTGPAGGGSGGGGEWIMWDDGMNVDGIGLTGGGVFSVASRWDPDMIAQYDGQYITKIRLFVYANVVNSVYTLNVWEGANAGTMIYEETLSGLIVGDWNEITLATPVELDVTQELWFGYTVDQPDGENPAGCDAGPATVGYGDMIALGGAWEPIANYGFDLNWNLQAFIGDPTDNVPSVQMTYENNIEYTTPGELALGGEVAPTPVEETTTRALTGYNVYWSNDGAAYEYLDFTTDTFYMHIVDPMFEVGTTQCYYVTAVFEDCEPASDEACWIVTSISDPELSNEISVYPNPARDILNIQSSSDISHVTIMNYVGQVVYNQKVVEDNDLQLNVAGYETGVYMVKIETSAGIVVKKVTIAH